MRIAAVAVLLLALPVEARAEAVMLQVEEAAVDPHWHGTIRLRFTPQSRVRFAELTRARQGDRAIIHADGAVIARIMLFGPVEDGRLSLMGLKTDEAGTQTLALRLHHAASALTVTFEPGDRNTARSVH